MLNHRRLLDPLVLVILVFASGSCLVTRGESQGGIGPKAELKAAQRAKRIWIVVNLFTGQTSKQAVRVKDALERLGAQGNGIVLSYRDVTVENILSLNPSFLALSPNGTPWCRYKGRNRENLKMFLKSLRVLIEDYSIPVVGICGGHQALALAFGGKVGPVKGGEDDCFPHRNNPTERGRHYVTIVKDDPIFLGMPKKINMAQNHFDEVKRMPPGFICLAQNNLCPYQIIRHPSKPVYGVQAHSEYYFSSRPDGGLFLRNFIVLAQNHNKFVRDGKLPDVVSTGEPVRKPGTTQKTVW